VADTVPIFAQAAGAKLAYVAEEAASPSAQAILVPSSSSVKSLSDLKGKRIAVTKGAGSHFLLLAALSKAGLTFKDIAPAYLTPADGRAAFVSGNVDAWVAWDPFLTSASRQTGGRILADGSNGLASYKRYYVASAAYAARRDDVLNVTFGKLAETGKWLKAIRRTLRPCSPGSGASTPLRSRRPTATALFGRRGHGLRPVGTAADCGGLRCGRTDSKEGRHIRRKDLGTEGFVRKTTKPGRRNVHISVDVILDLLRPVDRDEFEQTRVVLPVGPRHELQRVARIAESIRGQQAFGVAAGGDQIADADLGQFDIVEHAGKLWCLDLEKLQLLRIVHDVADIGFLSAPRAA